MTDLDPQLTALAILREMEDTLAAIQSDADDDLDEEVNLRLVEQMEVLLDGLSTLVDEDAGGFVDDLGPFNEWADAAGVEVHG